tara:strand:- start:7206 stop:7511 length:306 start_codon:yes stop_codon:yes gene_type:complete
MPGTVERVAITDTGFDKVSALLEMLLTSSTDCKAAAASVLSSRHEDNDESQAPTSSRAGIFNAVGGVGGDAEESLFKNRLDIGSPAVGVLRGIVTLLDSLS